LVEFSVVLVGLLAIAIVDCMLSTVQWRIMEDMISLQHTQATNDFL